MCVIWQYNAFKTLFSTLWGGVPQGYVILDLEFITT